MGIVMSLMGFGAALGNVLLNGWSDWIGRRPVFVIALAGGLFSLALLAMTGPHVPLLFCGMFAANFFLTALIALTMGPLAAESVPPSMMATASGMVMAAGEVFGGGIAPIIGGFVADRFGIAYILWLPFAALLLGFLIWAALTETLGNQPQAENALVPSADQSATAA